MMKNINNPENTQPIFILSQDTSRTAGKTAQHINIAAAKLVADTVRTTLGPKGMDKMLVDSIGDIVVTNDGVTILEEMSIEHPAAKMIVEVAKTQEEEIGDGTTTAVVLAGELLKNAEELLEKDVHPTVIAKGYRLGLEKAMDVLNNISKEIDRKDKKLLMKIANTAMTGKGIENAKEKLSSLVVDSILSIEGELSRDSVKIVKRTGASLSDSQLIRGIVIDKERLHPDMPNHLKDAKIVLLDAALEVKRTEIDAKISITDPEKMQEFLDMEEEMIKKMIDKIINTGANVVFCQKGIDDLAQYLLVKNGVFAVRRVSKSDMERLAKATAGRIITSIDDLSSSHLGKAGYVYEKKFGEEAMIFVEDCKHTGTITLLIRGGSDHVIEEARRAVEDAIGDIVTAVKDGKVVAGASACEMEIARQIRKFANTLSGREQLAVQMFAKSLESIPETLAENAGLDPIDTLAKLKAEHEKKNIFAGINVFSGGIMDAWKEGVIEPLRIKSQALSSATEVAIMILRIDDVVASKRESKEPRMPQYEE